MINTINADTEPTRQELQAQVSTCKVGIEVAERFGYVQIAEVLRARLDDLADAPALDDRTEAEQLDDLERGWRALQWGRALDKRVERRTLGVGFRRARCSSRRRETRRRATRASGRPAGRGDPSRSADDPDSAEAVAV